MSSMLDGLTFGVGPASCWIVTGVLALVLDAGLVVAAVRVGTAADDAVSLETDLLVQAVAVLETSLYAVTTTADFAGGAFVSGGARRSATTFLADKRRRTRGIVVAERRNAHTSRCTIVGLAGESVRAIAAGFVVINTADGVRTAGVGNAARRLTHR